MSAARALRGWRLPAALGAALLALAYARWLPAPLAWDDRAMIENNAALASPVPWSAYVSRDYFALTPFTDTWRPLQTLATRAVARAAGRSPLAHHAASLAIHLAAALLLAGLAASLGSGPEGAAWTAALFALHPANVESVCCASHNSTLLAGAALAAMLWAHRRGRYGLAGLACALAMLAKEYGILGPVLAAWMDASIDRRPRWRAYAGYAALAAAYAVARFGLLPGTASDPGRAISLPWTDRAVLGAQAWLTSWRVLWLPLRLRIEYFAVPPAGMAARAAWLAAALASAAALAWAARRSRGLARFAWLLPVPFAAGLSPLLPANILNLRLTAERFLYVPSMAVALLAVWALRGRRATLAALLVVLGLLSALRAGEWADEPRLWEGLVSVYPWSSKAHEGLGEAWMRRGRYREAAEAYEAAWTVRRDRADRVLRYYAPRTAQLSWERASVHRGLGLARLELGELEEARAHLQRALELDPSDTLALDGLAYLEARRGRFDEARRLALDGLRRKPDDAVLAGVLKASASRTLDFRVGFY